MRIDDIDAPPIEPVDLAYTKTFLRVDGDSEDALIFDLIRSARERIARLILTSLIARRRTYNAQTFALSGVFINHSPVTEVLSVNVVSANGVITDVPLSTLKINLRSRPVSLCVGNDGTWGQFAPDICALDIEVMAGYGVTREDIPMPIRQAILLLVAESYEHRGQAERPSIPMMVDALLMPYRSLRL